jgi:hypothetical protein
MNGFRIFVETDVSFSQIQKNPFEAIVQHGQNWRWMEIYDQALQKFMKNYKADPTGPVTKQLALALSQAHEAVKTGNSKLLAGIGRLAQAF